ncbi:MAG: hypothetical protein AAFO29_23255, partial [Actinomycetota bacterium]
MTDTVRVGNSGMTATPTSLPGLDQVVPEAVRQYVVPVAMALLCVIAMLLTASRLSLLLDWSERYDGAGEHIVTGCSADALSGG